jgi:hypothetical protein
MLQFNFEHYIMANCTAPVHLIKSTEGGTADQIHYFLGRNVGKGCVHKTQSGQTLPQTLRKRELRALYLTV